MNDDNAEEIFRDDLRLKILANVDMNTTLLQNPSMKCHGKDAPVAVPNLTSTMVHYFCIGGRQGQILSTFKSPVCNVSEHRLRYQCKQILIHAAKTDTDMVQMMASNSEMIYYHQMGDFQGETYIFIVAVPSKYRGDPVVQVLSDFQKIFKTKQNQAAQLRSPEYNFTTDFLRKPIERKQPATNEHLVRRPQSPAMARSHIRSALYDRESCKKWPKAGPYTQGYRRPRQSRLILDEPQLPHRRIPAEPSYDDEYEYQPEEMYRYPPDRDRDLYYEEDVYSAPPERSRVRPEYEDRLRFRHGSSSKLHLRYRTALPRRGLRMDPRDVYEEEILREQEFAHEYDDHEIPPPLPRTGMAMKRRLPARPRKRWTGTNMEDSFRYVRERIPLQSEEERSNVSRIRRAEYYQPSKRRMLSHRTDQRGMEREEISIMEAVAPTARSAKRLRTAPPNAAPQFVARSQNPSSHRLTALESSEFEAKETSKPEEEEEAGPHQDLMETIHEREALFEKKMAALKNRHEKSSRYGKNSVSLE
eukprot:CAMPEP_0184500040 /NCGR_PEP_ID=MMETSP0113_2-20130426/43402_1 /TAXON_ID=91329 /ORGANISM="Norrisiella sphaerica, Strain BC52" /LENGTH=529 /DNA_ID=CAMNT_0026888229 /DNA_START=65 /DNA_END=1654 /DNA_ORIENTATION=-